MPSILISLQMYVLLNSAHLQGGLGTTEGDSLVVLPIGYSTGLNFFTFHLYAAIV